MSKRRFSTVMIPFLKCHHLFRARKNRQGLEAGWAWGQGQKNRIETYNLWEKEVATKKTQILLKWNLHNRLQLQVYWHQELLFQVEQQLVQWCSSNLLRSIITTTIHHQWSSSISHGIQTISTHKVKTLMVSKQEATTSASNPKTSCLPTRCSRTHSWYKAWASTKHPCQCINPLIQAWWLAATN